MIAALIIRNLKRKLIVQAAIARQSLTVQILMKLHSAIAR